MSFEFEDSRGILINRSAVAERPALVSFLIKHRLVSSESTANKILFWISMIILFVSLSLITWFTYENLGQKQVTYKLSKDVLIKLPQDTQQSVFQ